MQTPTKTPRRVQVLPHGVAERIAAGEVIERPSSVVKELVENSIDAGATEIAVLLEEGGKALIEVMDNGHGMVAEDLLVCLERHATSKLSSLEDLEKIHTLGFRGEALPSIAAVSDLSLISRASNSETAYEVTLTSLGRPVGPEAKTFGHFLGTPHGTRIQARGLFSQVPARLKFLKSQGAEVSQVREWIERLALAHPGIGFRLVSDGRSILTLRPQEETARIQAVLSDGEDYPIITASNDLGFRDRTDGSFHVRAHWLQGLSSPQAKRLVQVINGRAVRDRMLQQAVMGAFRQALLPGQFPAVALYIEIDPSEIDVNVHPTKTEIRFLDNRSVFRAVNSVIDTLIARHGATAFVAGASRPAFFPGEAPESTESPGSQDYSRNTVSPPSVEDLNASRNRFASWRAAQPEFKPMAFELNTMARPEVSAALFSQANTPGKIMPNSMMRENHPGESSIKDIENKEPGATFSPPSPNEARGRLAEHSPLLALLRPEYYMGSAFNTYLFYELGDELGLVDQHAAHERIRYEALKKSRMTGLKSAPQALLIPEAVRFAPELRGTLEGRLDWLNSVGFEAEIFGEDTALFRAIPAAWGANQLRTRLKNLIDRILALSNEPQNGQAASETSNLAMDEILFEALASEACHSAVRAGDRLEREEATHLVQKLFECEHPWNCPHGRPTIVRVPKSRIEEWFQRRV
jgi:DNA mismatch repair protein MutL